MPDVFVPLEIAASFVAYMRAQGSALPASFAEARVRAALDNPSLPRQPQETQLPSTSPTANGPSSLAGVLRRTRSASPEGTAGREDFTAGA